MGQFEKEFLGADFYNIDFFGKKEATFIAEKYKVNIDTTSSIPIIYPQNIKVNWSSLKNKDNWANIEAIKGEILDLETFDQFSDSDSIVKDSFLQNIDENIVEGISPIMMLNLKDFQRLIDLKGILSEILEKQGSEFGNISVYLENNKLDNDELKNINSLIDINLLERILIFGKNIPESSSDKNDCTIVLKL